MLLPAAPLASHAEAPPAESPFAAFAGLWQKAGSKLECNRDPHPNEFVFSDDRRTFYHYIDGPIDGPPGGGEMLEVAEFQVVQTSPHVRVRHETDTPTSPSVFDLIFPTHDQLCWHRPGDPAGSCAESFDRCKQ